MKEPQGLRNEWKKAERWKGITRPYRAEDVERLRGSVRVEYTIASLGAHRLWRLLTTEDFVPTLGAMTGTQAVQMVQGGLPAIYASGWQVAADANDASQTYPDQSLYPVGSMPTLVRRINNAFRREDEKQHAAGQDDIYWYAPIVADAEAGFGGTLNVFELTKALIDAGTAGLHIEDQLASVKKCGHLGGKVLVPAREFNQKLWAARLAADILDVPTILIARTDAPSAKLITSDIDPRDRPFLTGDRTPEGFYGITGGLDMAIARGLAYAPFADLVWFETAGPDLDEARRFAHAIHAQFPGKMLAYNCSPSFNWRQKLSASVIADFQQTLAVLCY
jgi:isocitrate lyase